MVRYHRHHQLIRKGGEPMKDEVLHNENIDSGYNCKRTRSRLFSLFFLTLLSCCFVLAPSFIGFSFNIPHFCKFLSSLLPLFFFSLFPFPFSYLVFSLTFVHPSSFVLFRPSWNRKWSSRVWIMLFSF